MFSISSLDPRLWLYQALAVPTVKGMVIVAGMPKSGTTVITKLLAAATRQSVCSDPFFQLDRMNVDFRDDLFSGEISLEHLWRRYRRVFAASIIKDPNFPLLMPQISNMFPDARMIFIIRDPRSNIRSILNRLKLPGNSSNISFNDRNISPAWLNALNGRSPDLPGNNYIEHLAWRWNYSAKSYFEFKDKCLCIRYEDFMMDKQGVIKELAEKLGYLDLSPIDHLLNVQYQPKGDHSTHLDAFFGKENLSAIEMITKPYLKEFEYE